VTPVRFRVRTWRRVFVWMFLVAVAYLTFSAVPPTVMAGVYVGVYLVVSSGGFLLYTNWLVRKGRGEEYRP